MSEDIGPAVRLAAAVAANALRDKDLGNTATVLVSGLDELLAQLDAERARSSVLRKLLWLRHSSEHFGVLYGDDGEMQCPACMLDFKRDEPTDIEKRWVERSLQALADAALKEGG